MERDLENQIVCGMEGETKLTDEQFARVVDHWKRLNPRRMLTEQEVLQIISGLPKYGEAYPVHDFEADSEDQADQPNS